MINRDRLEKVAEAIDSLGELGIRGTCDIKPDAQWSFWAWCPAGMEEERRRKVIAIVTPLVGKMRVSGDHWRGENEAIDAIAYKAQACKIVGYKTERKIVKREIARDPEYEDVEEEVRIPITDCDLKAGKFSEEDIEVTA